ncbi:alpha-amylase family glycosyl hydrolase [Hymenobacter coccineus]|uniref:Glycosyl hydrolase family 13 catalytic domain-containing protein n=1 Tax=Hymenobacter coccineus TaxID=1908235 RepID=A0A1G1TJ30_9BACT|nr:alpha-amylase family glycosyl hydrolase [Hymenobacter coccineus]OGX90885.1 hypothetical protein BEN49_06050 [Hymenobacter coccineus]
MLTLRTVFKHSRVLAALAWLLIGCQPAVPDAPTPVAPTTATPAQYGTPYAGVPNREDAVIYQVNMRAFSQNGNFAGVTARLDSIKAIGVNVLYLMPIYPVGALKSVNSPYSVKDYTAVNPEFGTLDDLRTLVDGAHARGLAVMLDWVANHTSFDHSWITAHPDWYLRDGAGTVLSPPNTNYTDVAQLNFSSAPMRLAMVTAMKSWVYMANVDGFRCDYSDPVIPPDFWKQAIDTLRNVKTHKLLLLAEGTRSANFTSGFDYNFGFNFYGALRNVYERNGAATGLTPLNTSEYVGANSTQQVVRYTTNHDVNGTDGTPVALYGGNAGAMSAFVIASCLKGVPFVYNGQEAGMTVPITFPFTTVKVQWGQHPDVKRAYQQLLAARAASPALQHAAPVAYSTNDVCAFTKSEGSDQALVLVNVRNAPTQYAVPAALANTNWTNALQGGSVTVGTQILLPAYGYMILKK